MTTPKMKYYTSTTEYNCGIDLHARQMYVCVMDRQGKKLVHTNSMCARRRTTEVSDRDEPPLTLQLTLS